MRKQHAQVQATHVIASCSLILVSAASNTSNTSNTVIVITPPSLYVYGTIFNVWYSTGYIYTLN